MEEEPDDFELLKMLDRFPTEPRYEVDTELLRRRLDMTPAERVANSFKAKRLLERVVKRVRDKYAINAHFV
jgi:hypothetical protein